MKWKFAKSLVHIASFAVLFGSSFPTPDVEISKLVSATLYGLFSDSTAPTPASGDADSTSSLNECRKCACTAAEEGRKHSVAFIERACASSKRIPHWWYKTCQWLKLSPRDTTEGFVAHLVHPAISAASYCMGSGACHSMHLGQVVQELYMTLERCPSDGPSDGASQEASTDVSAISFGQFFHPTDLGDSNSDGQGPVAPSHDDVNDCSNCVEIISRHATIKFEKKLRDFCGKAIRLGTTLAQPCKFVTTHREYAFGYMLGILEPWKYAYGYCSGIDACPIRHKPADNEQNDVAAAREGVEYAAEELELPEEWKRILTDSADDWSKTQPPQEDLPIVDVYEYLKDAALTISQCTSVVMDPSKATSISHQTLWMRDVQRALGQIASRIDGHLVRAVEYNEQSLVVACQSAASVVDYLDSKVDKRTTMESVVQSSATLKDLAGASWKQLELKTKQNVQSLVEVLDRMFEDLKHMAESGTAEVEAVTRPLMAKTQHTMVLAGSIVCRVPDFMPSEKHPAALALDLCRALEEASAQFVKLSDPTESAIHDYLAMSRQLRQVVGNFDANPASERIQQTLTSQLESLVTQLEKLRVSEQSRHIRSRVELEDTLALAETALDAMRSKAAAAESVSKNLLQQLTDIRVYYQIFVLIEDTKLSLIESVSDRTTSASKLASDVLSQTEMAVLQLNSVDLFKGSEVVGLLESLDDDLETLRTPSRPSKGYAAVIAW